jgi:hypothetical protein
MEQAVAAERADGQCDQKLEERAEVGRLYGRNNEVAKETDHAYD